MNGKEQIEVAKLNTHIQYIRKNIDHINDKLDKLPCGERGEKAAIIKQELSNHLQMHRRDWIKMTFIFGAIISIVQIILKVVL